jgi:hypothetical protein
LKEALEKMRRVTSEKIKTVNKQLAAVNGAITALQSQVGVTPLTLTLILTPLTLTHPKP